MKLTNIDDKIASFSGKLILLTDLANLTGKKIEVLNWNWTVKTLKFNYFIGKIQNV